MGIFAKRLQNDAPAPRASLIAITISTKDSLPSLCVFFVDDFLGLDGHMDNVGGIRTEL